MCFRMVAATNDAPLRVGPAPGPLLLPLGSEAVTVAVSDLVSAAFTDPDGLATGAAVLLAAGSPLGRWEWAPPGATSWSRLEQLEGAALGRPAPDCGRLPTGGQLAALTRRLTGAERCRDEQTETETVTVSPQYLAPDDRLRYTADNASQVWSAAEADRSAVLVLAGWDQTASPTTVRLPDCSPDCGGSSSLSGSLLRVTVLRSDCTGMEVFSHEYASQRDVCGRCGGTGDCVDCHNDVNGTAYTDCGKCVGGKTGLEPGRDCASQCMENHIVAIGDSEMCVMKEPALQPPCDNIAGSGAYRNLCGHCVLGSTGLAALHGRDSCGRCAEDPAAAEQQPACLQRACDGSMTSPRRQDRCGQCRHPDSADWSACRRFGSPPPVVDVGQDQLTVRLPIRNQSGPWDPTLVSCHVQSSAGEDIQVSTYPSSTVTFRHGGQREQFFVGVNLGDLPLDTYDFSCGDDLSAASFSLVDSSALTITTMEPPEALLHEENKVEVVLVADPVPDAPVLLGLVAPVGVRPPLVVVPLSRVPAGDMSPAAGGKAAVRGGRVAAKAGAGGALTAFLPRLPSTGEYRALVAHDHAGLEAKLNKGCDSACQSSTATLRVSSTAPELTGAEFSSPYQHVAVTFDGPVWTEQGCEDLLDTATLQALGNPEGKECTVRGSQLLVRPGPRMAAPGGGGAVELTLAAGGAVVRLGSGGGPLAGRAAGSVTVNFTQALTESPRLSLLGPSVVCGSAGSWAMFRALPLQDLGRPLVYSWNVTLDTETTLPQATTLAVWQGINDVMSREQTRTTGTVSVYTIDTAGLVAGDFSYQVFVKAQAWTGASRTESHTFGVSDSGLSVAVTGPDRIARGGLYTYRAAATVCQQGQQAASQADNLQYSWRLPGVSASQLEGRESRTLRLDASRLVWQSEYRLTCVVTRPSTGDVFTDTLRLEPVSGGVKARLSTERRPVRPGQPVFIDGGRSEDLDGRPGQLGFSWSCQLADTGAGCFVGDGGRPPLERLEQRLGASAVSGPTLRIPAGLLAPEQRYRLTLRVEKDGDVDTAHTEVYVNSQPTPKLWIERQQDVFDPFKDIFVPAQVSTDWPVTVVWETDFPLVPAEALNTSSFRPVLVPVGAHRRHFDLVLRALERPGGEDGCGLCGKVVRFVLRADMEVSDSLVFSAEVDLRMMDAPLLGELKVSPGDGLMTSLDASEGWMPPVGALQLSYEFGYVAGDGLRVPMATVTSDVPSTDILLPRDAGQVYVRVCPAGGVCLTVDSDVTPTQDTVSDETDIRVLAERLVNVSFLGRPVETLAWSAAVLDRRSPQQSTAAAADTHNLTAIVHFVAHRALVDINDRLQAAAEEEEANANQKRHAISQADLALALLPLLQSALPALPAFSLSGPSLRLQELVRAVLAPPTGLAAETFDQTPPPSSAQQVPAGPPVRLPGSQVANLRRIRRSLRRHKRAVPKPAATEPINAVQALRMLKSASSDKTRLPGTAESLLASLCAGLPSTNSQPVAVLGGDITLQAARRGLEGAAADDSEWPLVEGREGGNGSLLRPSDDWRRWQWECGVDREEEVAILCRDMCVTSWVAQEDLVSISADRLQRQGPPLRTAVYNVRLLHPTTLLPQFADQKLKLPYVISIALNTSMELPKNRVLECRHWTNGSWSGSDCVTGPAVAGRLPCSCTRLGSVAAFEVAAPEPTPTTTPPPTPPPTTSGEPATEPARSTDHIQNITLRINGDYEAIVGDNKEQFESHMREQIASSLNISLASIISLTASPGSIILDIAIDGSRMDSRVKADEGQDPLRLLTQLVESGRLELTDLQGNQLVIPRDGIGGPEIDPVKEEANTRTAVIIGAVIAAIVVLCVIGVIVAVIVKNKKRSKVGMMTSPTERGQQNTYKSFQFEHVMDGTAASLEKYKSSRGMDDSDRYLAETMRAHSAAAVRRASIPRPARYNTPSREQLEATQAVPETLKTKIDRMQNHLPGTPEETWND